MPEYKAVKVFRPLLMQLTEAKSKHGSSSDTDDLFGKIEDDIDSIKKTLISMERRERNMHDEIGDIVKRLNLLLENSGNTKDEIPLQLKAINHMTSVLKESTARPVHLSEAESTPSTAINDPDQRLECKESDPPADLIAKVKEQYESLNHYYKHCLNLLLMFPERSVIKKRMVLYCWMADHIVTNIDSEEDGEECLTTLINMGFIAPIFRRHSPRAIDSLRIHPQIEEELVNLRHYEAARSKIAITMPLDDVSQALALEKEVNGFFGGKDIIFYEPGYRIYRSRICFNLSRHYLQFEKHRFMRMRRVVAAQLGRWQSSPKHHIEVENTEFLVWLKSFTELRYLSLQGISRIMELPPSIGSLHELRILDLRACHNLESLPVEIIMLRNLTHLDVSECCLLDHMPIGLGSLYNLQVLKGFVVGSLRSRDPCRPWELSNLKKLRKLSIKFGRYSWLSTSEVGYCFATMESLHSLTITWAADTPSSSSRSRQVIFAALNFSPPPNLQKLDLRCFPQAEAPWVIPTKLAKVERLYIRGGKLASLNSGVQWPSVKILRLRSLHDMEVDKPKLRESFSNLDCLEIYDCKSSTASAL